MFKESYNYQQLIVVKTHLKSSLFIHFCAIIILSSNILLLWIGGRILEALAIKFKPLQYSFISTHLLQELEIAQNRRNQRAALDFSLAMQLKQNCWQRIGEKHVVCPLFIIDRLFSLMCGNNDGCRFSFHFSALSRYQSQLFLLGGEGICDRAGFSP